MSRGAALVGALLVTLATPASWAFALAAFLIRGGVVLVALPILVLPTPVGLGNVLAPTLISIAFGSVSLEIVAISFALVSGVLAWLLLGGWLAAALEAEGARIVASDEEVVEIGVGAAPSRPPTRSGARTAGRIVTARLLADIPLLAALAWGSARIVSVAYRELTSPVDVTTPIVLRVLRASPEVVAAIVLTWMGGEMVGAVAARRIALAGDGVFAALRGALVTLARGPLAALVRFWLPTIVLLIIVVLSAMAVGSAWDAVRAALTQHPDPPGTIAAILLFVALWAVSLLFIGVVCAWRAAVWTVVSVTSKRTFGGSSNRQPGDWRSDPSSASL